MQLSAGISMGLPPSLKPPFLLAQWWRLGTHQTHQTHRTIPL